MWDETPPPPPENFDDVGIEEGEEVRCLLLVKLVSKKQDEYEYQKIVDTSPGAIYLRALKRSAYGKYVGDTAAGDLSVFSYHFANVNESEVVEAVDELAEGGWLL